MEQLNLVYILTYISPVKDTIVSYLILISDIETLSKLSKVLRYTVFTLLYINNICNQYKPFIYDKLFKDIELYRMKSYKPYHFYKDRLINCAIIPKVINGHKNIGNNPCPHPVANMIILRNKHCVYRCNYHKYYVKNTVQYLCEIHNIDEYVKQYVKYFSTTNKISKEIELLKKEILTR